MNINEPLFPSGISLARAKKDAKKLKKLEDITLTQALNRVAQQHMSNPDVTWEQSITELKSTHAEVVSLFEDCLSKSELEQFLSVIEQDTCAGDSFISIAYFGESERSFRFYPITFSSSFSSLPVLP